MSDSTKTKRKKTKRRAIIYKAIHIKLKIEQYVLTALKPEVNFGAPEGWVIPALVVASVVLLCYKPGNTSFFP